MAKNASGKVPLTQATKRLAMYREQHRDYTEVLEKIEAVMADCEEKIEHRGVWRCLNKARERVIVCLYGIDKREKEAQDWWWEIYNADPTKGK